MGGICVVLDVRRAFGTGVLLMVLLIGHRPAWGQDVVIFDNGDRITGTIKSLDQGELIVDAPVADGDLHLDWRRVARVESDRFFQFQLSNGVRFLGRIRPETDPEAGTLVVEAGGVTETYRREHIVSVVRTVGQLQGLLEVSAGGGLSVSKSNDQKQFNADTRIGYEAPNYEISGEVHSLFSTQRSGEDTNRHSAALRFTWRLDERWGLSAVNQYLNSQEQRLDLRTVLGGGPSYVFVRNGQVDLGSLAGAVWNNERYEPDASLTSNNNLEGLAGVVFAYYRFKQWELDSSAFLFPSITSAGRVRSTIQANFRVRMIQGKSLWLNVGQTLDLDSDPPDESPGTDYVTTTSVTYTFP